MTDMATPQPVIPDSIEPFLGYKSLRLSMWDDSRLHSPSYPHVWEPQQRACASCLSHPPRHRSVVIPYEFCSCGFYAIKPHHRIGALDYMNETEGILVEIALWGKMIMGDWGARGQYAYPQKIVAWTCSNNRAERVASIYGIEIAQDNLGLGWFHGPLVTNT